MIVSLIAVMSIDGLITRHDAGGVGFASAEDGAHFRAELARCDSSIFGSGTYDADREHIRRGIGLARSRRRIVLTSRPNAYRDDVVAGELEFSDASPSAALDALRSAGHQRCALLGGGRVYGAFLAAGLVDELVLTVEPVLFGAGVRLCATQIDERFELREHRMLNPSTLLLRYDRAG
ncbi:MAG: dihydrofolate reductase family protein [Acidimicrobiia bacterium]|nr:dihydrofolate reductase family protein [Acidimicrobiia bacterium]